MNQNFHNNIEDFTNSSAHSDRFGQEFSLFSAYANDKEFMKSLDKGVVKDNENYTEPKYYLGDLIPGTYCSRIFSDCDKKACRLQSPNYPGMYPRNLTCYYAVRQVCTLSLKFKGWALPTPLTKKSNLKLKLQNKIRIRRQAFFFFLFSLSSSSLFVLCVGMDASWAITQIEI